MCEKLPKLKSMFWFFLILYQNTILFVLQRKLLIRHLNIHNIFSAIHKNSQNNSNCFWIILKIHLGVVYSCFCNKTVAWMWKFSSLTVFYLIHSSVLISFTAMNRCKFYTFIIFRLTKKNLNCLIKCLID